MHIIDNEVSALIKKLAESLAQKQYMLATAESCTGGELGAMITEVPGVSKVYAGGVVTYADDLKIRLLKVAPELIKKHGAVSSEVAAAMALGVVKVTGASVGVSLTGVAGPDGGTIDKPVGTVWCGLAHRDGTVASHLLQLKGERAAIRYAACKRALTLLIEFVNGAKAK